MTLAFRHWICFFSIPLFSSLCFAVEGTSQVDRWFESGNSSYTKGDFKGAIEDYERITGSDFVNETVYYNLANAYYKNNQIGKAILYYEKARKYAPRDPEILTNLNMATSRMADKVESVHVSFGLRQLNRIRTFLSIDTETIVVLITYLASNVLFSVYVLGKKEQVRRLAFRLSVISALLFLGIGSSNALRIYESRSTREGIVLVEKVDVLSGPGAENPTLFSIHEGLKVTVQHELGEWLLVSLENGWSGWIEKAVVGTI